MPRSGQANRNTNHRKHGKCKNKQGRHPGRAAAARAQDARWRGATVDDLASRRGELAAVLDEAALLTEGETMARLGLDWGDWRRSRDHGVIPGPSGPVPAPIR